MSSKKVAVLLPRLYRGGVTRVAVELVKRLEHVDSLEFEIITTRIGVDWHKDLDSKVVKISPLPYPELAYHRPDVKRKLKKSDILFNHSLYLNKFGRLIPEVPMLSVNHTHHTYETSLLARNLSFKSKLQRNLKEKGVKNFKYVDTAICVSDRIKRRTSDIYKGPAGRIYNGGNSEWTEFSDNDEGYIFAPDNTGPTVQNIAGDYEVKALGNGSSEDINWQGSVSDERLAELYKNASIIISDSWQEGFALYPLEAAFCGKASVLREAGGNAEAINHGETGFIANNSHEFQEYVDRLMEDQDLRHDMGERACERVNDKFTWEKAAEQYLAEINDLLGTDYEITEA